MKDILIACKDGLKGFPQAIRAAFSDAQIQLCIVHMVRNSMKYAPWKDYKPIAADLKRNYQSVTEEEAPLALEKCADHRDENRPSVDPAQPLASSQYVVPLPGGYSQRDLHHQFHRVLE